jgi:hypothetical protein
MSRREASAESSVGAIAGELDVKGLNSKINRVLKSPEGLHNRQVGNRR